MHLNINISEDCSACISYTKHKTNEYVRNLTANVFVHKSPYRHATVKRRKLAEYGHVSRHDCLSRHPFP
ncbi:hypothetical protein DPMN_141023 [Dreissena polymorpha]|uniref:Uncharacterized protein n=1 Tax=Dreissena polymorpha TaxID=45954 RepID=A0A9D4JM87_DREPO|nr:hypothetical protein DPMN_141023 [Dreissena polymorpha]